jgi:polysaccharide biosynthesis/export protein
MTRQSSPSPCASQAISFHRRSRAGLCGLGVALILGAPALAAEPQRASLPAPDPVANALAQQQEYRVAPHDTLEISVLRAPDLTQALQVDAAGRINFPLIGAVEAAGKTAPELERELAAKLGDRYLQDPQVRVFVKEAVGQRFTVEGAVNGPGVYGIQGRMTLLQAIATAKGLSEYANARNVVIFRTIEGQRRAGRANLAEIRSGKVEDPAIYGGDVIVVADSGSRRFLRDLLRATPIFNLFGP